MGQIIQSAFADAWPLFTSRKIVYLILIVIAALCWVLALNLPPAVSGPYGAMTDPRLGFALDVVSGLGGLAVWFVIPAAVRTIQPSFAMTVGRVFGIIGIAIVIAVVIGVGMGILYGLAFWLFLKSSAVAIFFGALCIAAALIYIFWIGIRWSQVVWAYLLSEPPNPFAASWRLTAGRFWQTFGFLIVLSILATIVLGIVFSIVGSIAFVLPVAGFVTVPLGLAVYIWLLNVVYLGELRWFVRLQELASAGARASATF